MSLDQIHMFQLVIVQCQLDRYRKRKKKKERAERDLNA